MIPLTSKPEDLLTSKGSDKQIGRMVFNLPSVEVGSILEYSYQLRYDDDHYSSPFWQIQQPYYVHKAHYAFTPFKAFLKGIQNETSHYLVDSRGNAVNTLIWWSILPQGAKMETDAVGRYSLDVSDIPSTPDEDWMPPMQTFLFQVLFYYKSAFNSADYWKSEAARWSKDVDHFAEPTNKIREAVAGIVGPSDSDLDKAKKLYKAVQALDNTDFSRAKGKAELKQLEFHVAKRAEDTWAQKSGSSEDIALLYLAMLRSLGLTAYDMKVVDRNRNVFSPGYLNFDQLDDDVVILSIGGKEMVLDPGEKMCPFGMLHWKHAGAWGNISDGANSQVLQMPVLAPDTAGLNRTGTFTLAADGTIFGDMHESFTGDDATRERWFLKDNDTKEIREKLEEGIGSNLPGLDFKGYEFQGAADLDSPLKLDLHFTVANYAQASGPLLLLRPNVFGSHAHVVPEVMEGKPRSYPIELGHPGNWRDSIDIHLPPGYVVDETPDPVDIDTGFASYHSVATAKANQLHFERDYVVRQVEIPATKAVDFRKLESAILADERGAAVLKKQ